MQRVPARGIAQPEGRAHAPIAHLPRRIKVPVGPRPLLSSADVYVVLHYGLERFSQQEVEQLNPLHDERTRAAAGYWRVAFAYGCQATRPRMLTLACVSRARCAITHGHLLHGWWAASPWMAHGAHVAPTLEWVNMESYSSARCRCRSAR
jgi:hypothetical protein